MSAGLPIITTKTRGIADHLDEGTNAIFVPPRDSAALSRALERILDDALLRKRMAEANRKKVDEFAPSRVAAHYLDTLREIATS
jgi:glycosyltransferase involved in cell wall biosynthesis